MSHAARRKVENEFDIDGLSLKLVDLYAALLGQHGEQAPMAGRGSPVEMYSGNGASPQSIQRGHGN
jgi:hypothetical protein